VVGPRWRRRPQAQAEKVDRCERRSRFFSANDSLCGKNHPYLFAPTGRSCDAKQRRRRTIIVVYFECSFRKIQSAYVYSVEISSLPPPLAFSGSFYLRYDPCIDDSQNGSPTGDGGVQERAVRGRRRWEKVSVPPPPPLAFFFSRSLFFEIRVPATFCTIPLGIISDNSRSIVFYCSGGFF
jgi:hypothetical protein